MRGIAWGLAIVGWVSGCKRDDGIAENDDLGGPLGDDDDGGGGDDDDSTTTEPREPTTQFAEVADPFDLPDLDLGGTGPYMTGGQYYTTGAWTLLDIDGDGLVDLVHTADPDSFLHVLGAPNDPHWDVYLNKGGRFSATATRWTLPELSLGGTGLYATAGGYYTTGAWSTFDIDGDGLPDLVHTADPDSTLHVLGAPDDMRWDVYLNHGDGFDTAATAWSLPDLSLGGTGLYAPGGAYYTTGAWATVDMDSDGLPDLVHTADPDGFLHVLGAPNDIRWDVYFNNGSRFAAQADRWELPELSLGGTGLTTLGGGYYTTGAWSTFDIDGDGMLDLVHTADPDSSLHVLGAPDDIRWDVYLGDGGSFATEATRWELPELSLGGTGLYGVGGAYYTTGAWSTFDIDADGLPDLVHTADPDSSLHVLGAPDDIRWDVYRNKGAKFAAEPDAWAIPALALGGTGLFAPAGAYYTQGAWATFDIDGDLAVDLVHTADPGPSLRVLGYPDAEWQVYRGE